MGLILVLLCLVGVVTASAQQCGVDFAFSNYYASSMVLQRSPARAVVWGYGFNTGDVVTVTINVGGQDLVYETTTVDGEAGRPVWSVSMNPIEAGGPYNITATSADCVIAIDDVMFGDIWICSGQSNMYHTVAELDDPESTIEDSVNYPDVRMLFTLLEPADTPQEDAKIYQNWRGPNNVDLPGFSALCWLYGVNLNKKLHIPIGLVESCWGGTRIEAWSSPEALSVCFPDGAPPGTTEPNEPSVLYNAMIHPYLKMPIYGGIWYQGESNRLNFEDYACAQREMVEDWRRGWFESTGGATDAQFPFGITQLAPCSRQNLTQGFPNMRWAQTGNEGFLPTDYFQRFFMAVAIDLPDFDSPSGNIHPRYKRQIADRLAIAAFPIAYGIDTENRFQGPFPSSFVRQDTQMTITYDNGATVLEARDTVNTVAFETCCQADPAEFCEGNSDHWLAAPILSVAGAEVTASIPCNDTTLFVTGVRYAWRESPCPNLEQCALYSIDGSVLALPAPPFTIDIYVP